MYSNGRLLLAVFISPVLNFSPKSFIETKMIEKEGGLVDDSVEREG